MRVLVISDIHSNLEALNAVLAEVGDFDMIWSLGDIVGYGPKPNECIARLNGFTHLAIPGNHDWGVLGRLDLSDFNADARQANKWTREQLTPESRAYLEALPETVVEGDFTLAHGSPRHPVWEYLFDANRAKLSFAYFETTICLVGHTHVPIIFRDLADSKQCQTVRPMEGVRIALDEARYIINPGSVGQPRDGDPRAACVLIDTETREFEHLRVSYNIAETQLKMRTVGLPHRLGARLDFGW